MFLNGFHVGVYIARWVILSFTSSGRCILCLSVLDVIVATQMSESIILDNAGSGSGGRIGHRRFLFSVLVPAASIFHVDCFIAGTKYSSVEVELVKSPMGIAVVQNETTTPTWLVTRSL